MEGERDGGREGRWRAGVFFSEEQIQFESETAAEPRQCWFAREKVTAGAVAKLQRRPALVFHCAKVSRVQRGGPERAEAEG